MTVPVLDQPVRTGTALRISGLRRTFGSAVALDGLDLEVAPGELLALLGPSGCGRTTALRVLAGFEQPDEGQVLLDGEDIVPVPANRRDTAMVFQPYSLFPYQLSGGRQQRVAPARALALRPRLLLLDEPLSALDARVRVTLREEIRRLQPELGITTVFITHDQEEALSMADRVAVMNGGRLEQCATPTELYARPATDFVAEFVGTMNRVPGWAAGDGSVEVLGVRLPVEGPDGSGPVDVLVRPEALEIEEGGPARVTGTAFHGPTVRVRVALPDGTDVKADVPTHAAAALTPGTAVTVRPRRQPVRIASAGGGR